MSDSEEFLASDDPGLGEGGARSVKGAAEEPAPAPSDRLGSILESLLLVADRPIGAAELATLVGEREVLVIEQALEVLVEHYGPRGIQLHNVAGGWQLRTRPENAPWVQRLLAQKPVRLSRAQLETMAIVGYRQPITRPEIDEIRGVDSGGVLRTLLDRSLVRILGKKEEPGRPLLYGTTREFLEFFNLRTLSDLPTLREFHELSEEHQAQVAALEEAATPGTIEPVAALSLGRVDLPLDREEDLGEIDTLIEGAGARARAAIDAIGSQDPERNEGEQPA